MSGYILQPTAQEDIVGIRDYYLAKAGYQVARQMLVEFVELFRFLARTRRGQQAKTSSANRVQSQRQPSPKRNTRRLRHRRLPESTEWHN